MTNTQNQNVQNQSPKKEDEGLKIRVAKSNFNPVGEVAMTTTEELCKKINFLFKNTFDDYCGCSIQVLFNPQKTQLILNPLLFFNVYPDNKYDDNGCYAFKPVSVENRTASILERVQRISASAVTEGPKVIMSDDAKSALEEFFINSNMRKNKGIDFDETFKTQIINNSHVYVRVGKLDIIKLLKMIYDGNTTSTEYSYQPSAIANITRQEYGSADNWTVSITRLNWANEMYAAKQQGIIVPEMNTPVGIVVD